MLGYTPQVVGLETLLGVGLETPQVWAWRPPWPDPSISPWVWAWKPARLVGIPTPPPGDLQCPPAMNAPCHACPLSCMPLPHMPPATHAPCHAHPLATYPPAMHDPRHARSPVDRMTDACENITFPQLLLRAVIMRQLWNI